MLVQKVKTQIIEEDYEEFKQKIDFLKKGSKINILCSFTYITPNYDVISNLKELHHFVRDLNYRILFVMWDMNVLSNPYYKKYCANKTKDPDSFISDKLAELRRIAKSVGFDEKRMIIYKSSDLWKRLIFFKEDNLLQQYFTVLAMLPVKDYSDFRKCSHIFQISLDLFFANYFNKLYPEDLDDDIDIIFSDYYKNKLYLATRRTMIEEGLIKVKPLFLLMDTVPYVVYEERVPEWNMKLEEIKYILIHASNKESDFVQLSTYFNMPMSKSDLGSKQKIVEILSEGLYEYLQEAKSKYLETNPLVEESILNLSNKQEIIKIGSILKSKLFFDILVSCDGSKTTGQIAKNLKKSIATISAYCGKLKNLGLIHVDSNGKLKRNIKGVNVNFEFGF